MIYDNYQPQEKTVEKLSPEKLKQIAKTAEDFTNQKPEPVAKWAGSKNKRILELQLRAFKRLPSRILEEYMTEDEKSEYEGLVDSYS